MDTDHCQCHHLISTLMKPASERDQPCVGWVVRSEANRGHDAVAHFPINQAFRHYDTDSCVVE